MNVKLFALLIGASLGATSVAQAQETMNLRDCLNYGLQHNVTVTRAQLDLKANHDVIMQGVSAYLPQIRAVGTWTDNLSLQSMAVPDAFSSLLGSKYLKFGKQFNMNGGIQANQTIYDQTYISGIKAARQSNEIYEAQAEKTQQQVIYDISSTYYQAQITAEQKKLVEANLNRVSELVKVTQTQLDNGFAKQTDYDRLVVQKSNLETDLQNVSIGYTQLMLLLKFNMGMPVDYTIQVDTAISHDAEKVLGMNEYFAVEKTPDFQVLKANKAVQHTLRQQTLMGYVPSLSFNANYNYLYQSDDMKLAKASWTPYSSIGLNLSIPIFDGLNKHFKGQQQKIQLQQLDLDEKRLRESLKMQNINAQNTMLTKVSSVRSQHNNMDLAIEIYKTTQLQYQQGMATMADLLNAETSLKESQTNYLNAVVQLKIAELDALKSSGNIRSILE